MYNVNCYYKLTNYCTLSTICTTLLVVYTTTVNLIKATLYHAMICTKFKFCKLTVVGVTAVGA